MCIRDSLCTMDIPQIAVVWNWRNQDNISGDYSIHLRITINRVSKYYKIQIPKKVSREEWSGKDDAWVKPSHPFAFEINNKITEKKMLVHDLIKKYYYLNKPLSFPVIFRQLKRRGDANSFLEFMQHYIIDPPEKLQENTLKKVIKVARRENYIDATQMEFLFADIKISTKRMTKRIYLETDEIKKWKALVFSEEKKYLEH